MDKYIYDNSDLIKISSFDSISFKFSENNLTIEALKISNDKYIEGKLILSEVDEELKYSLEEYVNKKDLDKSFEEITKELKKEFIDFMDSNKRVFKIFEVLDEITKPMAPINLDYLIM